MYQLKYKIWLEHDGKIFGEGPYHLLKGIEDTGSLNTSAKGLKMSYSQAYKLIKNIEDRLGYPLIMSQTGGHGGGGSHLTEDAKKLMGKYLAFSKECQRSLQTVFEKHFSDTDHF